MSTQPTSNKLSEAIRAVGLRVTPGRLAALTYLSQTKQPLTATTLHDAIREHELNLATTYRILQDFTQAGLVQQVDLRDREAYFEIAGQHDHHHLVCRECRRVVDFVGCQATQLIRTALEQNPTFATVSHHSIELFGICKKCAGA